MSSTCALLGPVSGEMSREAVERLLADDSSIEVVQARTWSAAARLLAADASRFHVLIGDFGTERAPPIDYLLTHYPRLSIAAINLSSFDTHFRNIDSRLFVTFIGALGLDEPAEIEAARAAGRAVRSACAVVGIPAAANDVPYRRPDEQLFDLCAWVDAVLSRVLARAVGLTGGQDIAGLTMGVETARMLLGADNAGRDADALEQVAHAAEARLLARSRGSESGPLPLATIQDRFDLDALERRMLWLILAPDIDDRYARVIGVINDDLGRSRPTAALLAAALDDLMGAWQVLARLRSSRPFARYGLVAPRAGDAEMPWPQAGLICPRDIVGMVLTGGPSPPASLSRFAA